MPSTSLLSAATAAGWEFAEGPGVQPANVIALQSAVAVAASSGNGDYLTAASKPVAALIYLTAGQPVSVTKRLAWLIELDGVRIPYSTPGGYTGPTRSAIGTTEWAVDAVTGAPLGAIDFVPSGE